MGYFDSPKNKALWEKELESLDAERRRRKEEGYKPHQQKMTSAGKSLEKAAGNPKVRQITLKMLEEIERQARQAGRSAGANERQKQRAGEAHHRDRVKEKEEMHVLKQQAVSI